MIQVGVIGCGYWGQNLVRNFHQLKSCELQAVCDTDPKRIQYVHTNYPGVRTTEVFEDILKDPGIDAVVIALAAEMHFEFAEKALQAGKHTFVEKPLATTSRDAETLVGLAQDKGLVLMVGHTFEYNAAVRQVKKYIDEGLLGDIYYIYAQRLNLGRVRDDINAMWNLAPHDISIILYWLSQQPEAVQARGVSCLQEGLEDVVFLNMEFPWGVCAHIHTSWLDPNKVRKMTVVGSKKMVVYDDVSADARIQIFDKGIDKKNLRLNLGEYDDFGKFQLIQRAGDLLIPKVDFAEPLRLECGHFIECIEQGRMPLTDGASGLRVVKILEAASESLKNNGKVIKL
jgi:predicted dehydrogenase